MKRPKIYIEPFAPAGLFLLLFATDDITRTATLSSVLVHELGHLAAAMLCRARCESIRVTAFGLSLSFTGIKTYRAELATAIAGPFISVVYALTAYCLGDICVEQICFFSLFFGMMNLLPLPTFDGYRAAVAISSLIFGEEKASKICSVLSSVCLFFVWMLAVYVLFYSGVNITLLLFSVYIFAAEMVKRK